jgi:hypothetical protein
VGVYALTGWCCLRGILADHRGEFVARVCSVMLTLQMPCLAAHSRYCQGGIAVKSGDAFQAVHQGLFASLWHQSSSLLLLQLPDASLLESHKWLILAAHQAAKDDARPREVCVTLF